MLQPEKCCGQMLDKLHQVIGHEIICCRINLIQLKGGQQNMDMLHQDRTVATR